MSITEHIILFTLLFGVYAFWGKFNANKSNVVFWLAALVPILMYTLITGSRFGWGNDYFWYWAQFENPEFTNDQMAFKWLNLFIYYIGMNYVGAFMVYAFIFIVCAFVFTRSFGEYSTYMYCFLIPALLFTSTNTIRQGVATSFIFLALVFLKNKKWIYLCIVVIIAYYIHSAAILPFVALIGSFFVLKKPIHYAISIPLFLFFTFVYNPLYTTYLADFLEKYVNIGGKFQAYIDNSEAWFGENAINLGYVPGKFALFFSSLFYIAICYLGYQALQIRYDRRIVYIYNVVVASNIICYAVNLFEILSRIVQSMQMFYFVPVGYILYVYFNDCQQIENDRAFKLKKVFFVGIMLILADIVRYWGRFILLNKKADFFWHHFYDEINLNNFLFF